MLRDVTKRAKASETFHHDPIDLTTNTIRVFRILEEPDVISLELWHQEFDGQHTAVSYVWGPVQPVYKILINAKSHYVRSNLYDFLIEMREQQRQDTFWADAISIDQMNDHEKNHQVRQMWHMYSEAREACFWLGAGSEDFKLKDLRKLSESTRANFEVRKALFTNVLDNEFWKRAWIILEVLHGKSHGTILHGSSGMAFDEFASLLREAREVDGVVSSSVWPFVREDLLMGPARKNTCVSFLDESLSELLDMLKEFDRTESSDPRDRIFVPMSIVGGKVASMIDYSLSPVRIYATLLSIWVQPQFYEGDTATVESFLDIHRLLVRLLGLERLDPAFLGRMLNAESDNWSLAFRLEALGQPDHFSSVLHIRFVKQLISSHDAYQREFACCSCKDCRKAIIPLEWPRQVAIFSAGARSDAKRSGPYFLLVQGQRELHSLAYGPLSTISRTRMNIVRPFSLRSIDATALQNAFLLERTHRKTLTPVPENERFFDINISPADLVRMLWYKLGSDIVQGSSPTKTNCNLLAKAWK